MCSHFPLLLQVRLTIAEKGLKCEEYDVSLPLSEHNEPWFMRLNPAGEVPVLVHGDRVLCDPTQIMDYLEEHFTDGASANASACLTLLACRKRLLFFFSNGHGNTRELVFHSFVSFVAHFIYSLFFLFLFVASFSHASLSSCKFLPQEYDLKTVKAKGMLAKTLMTALFTAETACPTMSNTVTADVLVPCWISLSLSFIL